MTLSGKQANYRMDVLKMILTVTDVLKVVQQRSVFANSGCPVNTLFISGQ